VIARRLAAVLAAISVAAPAAAYVRSSDDRTGAELFWPMPVVPYHVTDAQPFVTSPSCAAGASGDPTLAAVQAGFAAWGQGCANLDLVYAGRIAEIRTGMGGTAENLVVFRKGWCSQNAAAAADPCMDDDDVDCGGIYDCFEDATPGDRSIVALTSVLYDPDSGRIVDADIEVNGWDGEGSGQSLAPTSSGPPHGWYFTCAKESGWGECARYGEAGCYFIDLQNTMTHEVGHFIGLAHPCEGASCTAALRPLTMFPATSPGDLEKRTLHADDVAGLCAIYPADRDDGPLGCSTGGAGGALAALVATWALARRRRNLHGDTRSH